MTLTKPSDSGNVPGAPQPAQMNPIVPGIAINGPIPDEVEIDGRIARPNSVRNATMNDAPPMLISVETRPTNSA